jgi:DNA-binding transcriptional LysR family regulator
LIKRVPQTQKIHYDIRDLRAVCELARQGGFKHAANALAITPSALSRRVAKLEEAIGGLIVNRTTRSIALTALGRRLVTRCEPLLRELDESVDESSRIARGMEGQIAVGCVSSIAYTLLPSIVSDFRKRHPDLRISLKDDDGLQITAAVLNYEVELGITTTVVGRDRDLYSELIATDAFVLVCAPDHPLANAKSLHWSRIASQRLMGFKSSSSIRQLLDQRLQREGLQLLWFDEVDKLSSLLSYLRTGSFVGVVPSLIASYLVELVAVPMIGPRIERRIYLTRRKDTMLNPPAQILWNAIKDRIATTTLPSEIIKPEH